MLLPRLDVVGRGRVTVVLRRPLQPALAGEQGSHALEVCRRRGAVTLLGQQLGVAKDGDEDLVEICLQSQYGGGPNRYHSVVDGGFRAPGPAPGDEGGHAGCRPQHARQARVPGRSTGPQVGAHGQASHRPQPQAARCRRVRGPQGAGRSFFDEGKGDPIEEQPRPPRRPVDAGLPQRRAVEIVDTYAGSPVVQWLPQRRALELQGSARRLGARFPGRAPARDGACQSGRGSHRGAPPRYAPRPSTSPLAPDSQRELSATGPRGAAPPVPIVGTPVPPALARTARSSHSACPSRSVVALDLPIHSASGIGGQPTTCDGGFRVFRSPLAAPDVEISSGSPRRRSETIGRVGPHVNRRVRV